jgi:zinc protease
MKRAALVGGLSFLTACGSSPPPQPPLPKPLPTVAPPIAIPEAARITPDAPFRANAPAPDGTVRFTPPRVVEAKLKNGLRVLVVERHELPVVSVRLVVAVGAGDVPGAKPGVVNFTVPSGSGGFARNGASGVMRAASGTAIGGATVGSGFGSGG